MSRTEFIPFVTKIRKRNEFRSTRSCMPKQTVSSVLGPRAHPQVCHRSGQNDTATCCRADGWHRLERALRDAGFRQAGREPLIAELGFDLFHPQGVPIVAGRQLHDKMPVIRQQHVGGECKRMPPPNRSDGPSTKRPPGVCCENSTTRVGDDGKEERPTRNKPSPIIGHSTGSRE